MQKAKAYAVEGLEEGGDDPKTAQDVVHALYAKYKKNVSTRRPPRPTQRDPAPDQPSPHEDPKKIPRPTGDQSVIGSAQHPTPVFGNL